MKGRNNFAFYSPTVIAYGHRARLQSVYDRDPKELEKELRKYGNSMPQFCLIHSVGDYVVPPSSSIKFTESLRAMGVRVEYLEYGEGTHYDSLFGLCDVSNVLFSRLIADITTRVFVSCFEYQSKQMRNGKYSNGKKAVNGKISTHHREVDKLEEITEENLQSMTAALEKENAVNVQGDEDRDELSDSTSALQSTESSSVISLDNQGNERKIEEEPVVNPVTAPNDTNSAAKRKKRRARPSIDITDSIHGMSFDDDDDVDDRDQSELSDGKVKENDENKSGNPSPTSPLETVESDLSELSDDEVMKNKSTSGDSECWEDLKLFDYADVSADTSKADEAVELMGNLLKDMDKALEAMANL